MHSTSARRQRRINFGVLNLPIPKLSQTWLSEIVDWCFIQDWNFPINRVRDFRVLRFGNSGIWNYRIWQFWQKTILLASVAIFANRRLFFTQEGVTDFWNLSHKLSCFLKWKKNRISPEVGSYNLQLVMLDMVPVCGKNMNLCFFGSP